MNCSDHLLRLAAVLAVCTLGPLGILQAGEPVRLTEDGRLKTSPVFVEGGEAIVYSVAESPVLMTLVKLDLTSGRVEPLHSAAASSESEPSFSPDARYTAFVQTAGVTRVRLIIRDHVAETEAVIDPPGGRNHLGHPSVAPDASRVVFSLPGPGGLQIASVNLEAGDLKYLTDTPGINDSAEYSPDGTKVAFVSSRDGELEIYSMNADGSQVERLTDSVGADLRPTWSPDGRQIAFTSARDGNYEIYVMAADGTQTRRLTFSDERDDYAAWHPDGKRLAIVSERAGHQDLYLVDVASALKGL